MDMTDRLTLQVLIPRQSGIEFTSRCRFPGNGWVVFPRSLGAWVLLTLKQNPALSFRAGWVSKTNHSLPLGTEHVSLLFTEQAET